MLDEETMQASRREEIRDAKNQSTLDRPMDGSTTENRESWTQGLARNLFWIWIT